VSRQAWFGRTSIVGGLVIDEALHGETPENWSRGMAALLWPRIAVDRRPGQVTVRDGRT
jgi:hypothetical protein